MKPSVGEESRDERCKGSVARWKVDGDGGSDKQHSSNAVESSVLVYAEYLMLHDKMPKNLVVIKQPFIMLLDLRVWNSSRAQQERASLSSMMSGSSVRSLQDFRIIWRFIHCGWCREDSIAVSSGSVGSSFCFHVASLSCLSNLAPLE